MNEANLGLKTEKLFRRFISAKTDLKFIILTKVCSMERDATNSDTIVIVKKLSC